MHKSDRNEYKSYILIKIYKAQRNGIFLKNI